MVNVELSETRVTRVWLIRVGLNIKQSLGREYKVLIKELLSFRLWVNHMKHFRKRFD